MKLMVGLVFCVALATGSVIDEFHSFKTRFNKVYKDESEVRKERIPIPNALGFRNCVSMYTMYNHRNILSL